MKTPYRLTFIRQWREHAGMTLEYLAERVGTTHATLSRLERGIFPYGQEMLERIAQVLTKGDVTALIDRDPKAACKQRGRGYGPRPKG